MLLFFLFLFLKTPFRTHTSNTDRAMRIRLAFEAPLPAYKCWFEVPEACKTVHDLQKAIRKGFKLDDLCKTTRLDLDGFYLLPTSTIAGSLKDSDLLQ